MGDIIQDTMDPRKPPLTKINWSTADDDTLISWALMGNPDAVREFVRRGPSSPKRSWQPPSVWRKGGGNPYHDPKGRFTHGPGGAAGYKAGRDLTDEIDWVKVAAHTGQTEGVNAPTDIQAYDTRNGGGDRKLAEIQKAQGFDGKPTVVTDAELWKKIDNAEVFEMYRGISDSPKRTQAQLAEDYRTGDLFPGLGIYGNGTYFGPDEDTASMYLNASEDYGLTGSSPGMIHAGLTMEAKTIDYDKAQRYASDRQVDLRRLLDVSPGVLITDQEARSWIDDLEGEEKVDAAQAYVLSDPGRWAAFNGYDAILVKAYEESDVTEIVVLNRTATIVAEAEQ